MTSGVEAGSAVPYGPLGLVLSLLCWVLLTIIYSLLLFGIAALADAVLHGWGPMLAAIQGVWAAVTGSTPSAASAPYVYAISVALYVAMAAASLSLARFRGGTNWRVLVAWRIVRPWWRDWGFWMLVVIAIAYDVLASAVLSEFYPPSTTWFEVPPGLTTLLLSFLVVAVAAPISEELLFRGWIYTSLRSRFGAVASVAISALLFASAHYDPTHLYALAVFPVGLILGALRERTGTFWATASLHALYNLSSWLFIAFGSG